jgi:hypothetical protein
MANKSSAKLGAQKASSSATCYAALAEKAYIHARGVAAKVFGQPDAYDWPWSRLPECQQKGYIAFVKYVIRNHKRYNIVNKRRICRFIRIIPLSFPTVAFVGFNKNISD